MKKCLDCTKDISDSGNRTIRCDKCQKKYRKEYNKQFADVVKDSNKKIGTARRTANTYQWAKEMLKLPSDDIRALISTYQNRLKNEHIDHDTKLGIYWSTMIISKDICLSDVHYQSLIALLLQKEWISFIEHSIRKNIRTRLKILSDNYKRLQPSRGVPRNSVYGKDSICEDCVFNNTRQLKCTICTEEEQDEAIKSGDCDDYEYDTESKYREEYYALDIERNDNTTDEGDYNYTQYEDSEE